MTASPAIAKLASQPTTNTSRTAPEIGLAEVIVDTAVTVLAGMVIEDVDVTVEVTAGNVLVKVAPVTVEVVVNTWTLEFGLV